MKLVPLDFVRATYWIGAIVDALAAVQLLLPRGTRLLGFIGLREPGVAGQPAIIAAVLMLGFSVLLVWAHLRTRERRAVLTLTLGVVIALAAGNVALGVSGAMTWGELAPTLAIQAVLAVLFAASARIARAAAAERAAELAAGGAGRAVPGGAAYSAVDGSAATPGATPPAATS